MKQKSRHIRELKVDQLDKKLMIEVLCIIQTFLLKNDETFNGRMRCV